MKLKQYPKYIKSGMRWINDIPENWEVRKIKYLFKERSKKGFPDLPMLAATQTKGVVPKEKYENRTVIAQKDLHFLKLVEEGDFVISLRSFQGGIEYAYYRGIISPAYTVMIPDEQIVSSYFKYLAKSQPFVGLLKTCVTGIREGQNINYDILRIASIPLPSKSEQTKIGKYLDNKMLRINKFIRNKRRLIQLLKEQKQAIINQAVTRGINPDVKMKPSGVDWLGDVPEHWEVRRLRTVAFVRPSGVDKNIVEGETSVRLCNYVDVYKNEEIMNSMDFMNGTATQDEINKFQLKAGDVLITKDSEMWNDIAVPAYVPETLPGVICAYHLAIIRPLNINGEFLFRAFLAESIADQFRVSANGVTRYGLAQGAIKGAWFSIPPKEEQREIVNYIDDNLSKIHLAIEKANKEIELIQEYRARLISDVVTGKVDVRDIHVEDVAEEELLEDIPDTEEFEDSLEDAKEV